MMRKMGEHLERDETKIAIIEFILCTNKKSNEPGILESKIREHLKIKYGMTDQGNIRNHLKDLIKDKEKACLEKFPFEKRGKPNYWDITKLKHLRNIRDRYSSIQLNKYEKSLILVLHESGYYLTNTYDLKIFTWLRLSASFFNMCVDTGIKTLYDRTWEFYRHDRGFPYHPIIDNYRAKYQATANEDSPQFAFIHEIFLKIIRELPPHIDEDPENIPWETLDEKITEFTKDMSVKKMLSSLITEYILTFSTGYLYLLSDHFFHQDILLNDASAEEIEFKEKIADNFELFYEKKSSCNSNEKRNLVEKLRLEDLKLLSEIIFYHKQPSTYCSGCKNSGDVYQILMKKFPKI